MPLLQSGRQMFKGEHNPLTVKLGCERICRISRTKPPARKAPKIQFV